MTTPTPLNLSAGTADRANVDARLEAEQQARGIRDMRRASPTGRSEQIGFKVTPGKRQQLQSVALRQGMQQVEVVEMGIDLVEAWLQRKPQLDKIALERGIPVAEVVSMAIEALLAQNQDSGARSDIVQA